jgi:hypothetical protein
MSERRSGSSRVQPSDIIKSLHPLQMGNPQHQGKYFIVDDTSEGMVTATWRPGKRSQTQITVGVEYCVVVQTWEDREQ